MKKFLRRRQIFEIQVKKGVFMHFLEICFSENERHKVITKDRRRLRCF